MKNDPGRPTIVADLANEAEAAMLVAALEQHGVTSWMLGQLTSGFRAEVPGGVRVYVRESDMDMARKALQLIEAQVSKRASSE